MIVIREMTALPLLMHWRTEVIRNVFGIEPSARLLVANRQYYRRHIANGTHIAVLAEEEDETGTAQCGCGAICLSDELPSPDNPTGRCAYLMNIYVRKEFRNRGIAHIIIRHLVEEARKRECGKIYLETTVEGKPVYLSSGFVDMHDMMKYYGD